MSSNTPPPARTVWPTTTADPCAAPGAAPSLHHPARPGSRGGSSTPSSLWIATTGASTPIRGIRSEYGPLMAFAWLCAGSRGTCDWSTVAVCPGVGASADFGILSHHRADGSSSDPHAATTATTVTATRASPAINRASPRVTRRAGWDVGSGVMQGAAASKQHEPGCCSPSRDHQANEPSGAAVAVVDTSRHLSRHHYG